MIVVGLGTGRCGTASLAALLGRQPQALCFHELNPASMRFANTPRPVLNTMQEFEAILAGGDARMLTADLSRKSVAADYDRLCGMRQVRLLGDIGYYYLTYVEEIARAHPSVHFVCLRRDRTDTVESWLEQSFVHSSWRPRLADFISSIIMLERYKPTRNFWMQHDGTRWRYDDVWDKTLPKFPAASKREAIGMYWDYYYQAADRLAQRLPDRFRVFDTTVLGDPLRQPDLLSFCGVAPDHQAPVVSHMNALLARRKQSSAQHAPGHGHAGTDGNQHCHGQPLQAES